MAAVTASQTVVASSIVSKSAFTGRQVRATKVSVAAKRVSLTVTAQERPLWFPGSTPPAHLDGSLAGDYGFDPLGLASADTTWMVNAELVHCRWAMLGAAGIMIPDALRVAGALDIPRWDLAGVADYGIDWRVLLAVEIAAIGWAEANRWADILNPGSVNEDPIFKGNRVKGTDVGYPGFDPLGMGFGEASAVKKIRAKEIANGRLAMLANLGFWVQAAYTDQSPIENLLSHLDNPGFNNYAATAMSVFKYYN
eukprot:TRINITY_DN45_c0_g2_i1.p2 TRINITY_DN45_c0_g2~~TRINITY_DN45_c0_g2_i1.p2  ORF type:complete len:253 (+),score=4.94 TRINITY_DN45_c0_g2_i1:197-955(+)